MTPTLMQESAKLKMGLKKMKCCQPQTGNHDGQFHSTRGK